jgi:hypothetical protein
MKIIFANLWKYQSIDGFDINVFCIGYSKDSKWLSVEITILNFDIEIYWKR